MGYFIAKSSFAVEVTFKTLILNFLLEIARPKCTLLRWNVAHAVK